MTAKELTELIHKTHNTSSKLMKEWSEQLYNADKDLILKFGDMLVKANAFHIVGDYDVDGICSTYITYKALKELFPDKEVTYRFPKRFSEGYGINDNIRHEIERDCDKDTLIITVDNGIAGDSVINPLHDSGYKICILDHHNRPKENGLPNADIIVDPHAEAIDNPLTGDYWCGAGVCYQMFKDFISEDLRKELFFYMTLATVADCMDMVGGNWAYVKQSVENVRKGLFPDSMKELLTLMKQPCQSATEETFGFYLAPCLNAPGRMLDNGAEISFEYLLNPDSYTAQKIWGLNEERKALKEEAVVNARMNIIENGLQNNCPLWVYIPNLKEGVVGLVAGEIEQEFKVPTIVVTDSHNGTLKGSGRSPEGINLYDYLNSLPKEYFVSWGGHAGAAGLTMTKEGFNKVQNNKEYQIPRPKQDAQDFVVNIEPFEIPTVLKSLNALRPFGPTRICPSFVMGIDLTDSSLICRMVGQDKNHLSVSDIFNRYKIMSFYHTDHALEDDKHFFAKGSISDNYFMGKLTAQFIAHECFEHMLDMDKNKEISNEHISIER